MNVSSTMVGVIRTALTFLEAIHALALEVSPWMRASKCAMVYSTLTHTQATSTVM